ncbi:MAG: hypothetical protein ABI699_06200, partial [Caldimonas sp.]
DGARGVAAAAIHLACAELHGRRTDRDAVDGALAAAVEAAAGGAAAGPAELLNVQLARVDHLRETDRGDAALALLDALAPELARAAPEQQARALAARGSALMLRGGHTEAQSLMNEAIGLLEGLLAARPRLAALLLELARAAVRRGDLAVARRLAERAIAVHESIDAPSGLASALTILGVLLIHGGERPAALAALSRARALAQRCGDVPAHRAAILNLVKILVDEGDTEQASALLDEGVALVPTFEHRRSEQAFREARFYLYYLRGELAQARAEAGRLLAFADHGSGPFERIGARHLVVDLYLLEGDLASARRVLDAAQALCDAQRASAEGTLFDASQLIKQAWLAQAEGRAADALACLPRADALQRMEDRFACAWVGGAAARALGDMAEAQRRLDAVDLDAEVALDQLAPWLEQRLALASAEGRVDAPAASRARTLLAERRVPVQMAERLGRALAAAATGGAS